MVSPDMAEATITQIYELEDIENLTVLTTGMPSPAPKAKRWMLLKTREITAENLRAKLTEAGLPNLWIPQLVQVVERTPMLGIEKLDLKIGSKLGCN